MKSFDWKKTKTVFAVLLYLSLFFFSDTVRKAAAEAINNCLTSLLPTVFPVMILSSWITALIMDGEKKRRKRSIAGLIFLAVTGGYLIGSVLACDLYRNGSLNKKDAAKTALYNIHPGIGFTVAYVGIGLCGSVFTGIVLYVSVTLGNLFTRLILGAYIKTNIKTSVSADKAKGSEERQAAPLIKAVNVSINAAAKMCGWILLFAAITAPLKKAPGLSFLPLVLEVTAGVKQSIESLSLPLCAFVLGFGGICLYLQLLEFMRILGVSFPFYFLVRTVSGALSSLIVFLFSSCYPAVIPVFSVARSSIRPTVGSHAATAGLLLLCTSLMLSSIKNRSLTDGNG